MDSALGPLIFTGIGVGILGGFYFLIALFVFWVQTIISNVRIRRRNKRILDNVQRHFNGDL